MREKFLPWVPALFCAGLSMITLITNIVSQYLSGDSNTGLIAFLCFLPICFIQVGEMLRKLQLENQDLRNKLNELSELQNQVA